MDTEERKDGKEKQWENESTNKKVKKKATCVVFSELDERFLSQKSSRFSDWLEHISVRKRAGYRKLAS